MNKLTIIIISPSKLDASRAIKSAAFADEILLIATCEKRTQEIGKLTQLHMPLENNFSEVRNEAMKLAKYDWVLFLDSDEKITLRLQEEIKKFLTNETKVKGVFINRKDIFLGKKLEFGETGKIKLLRLGVKSGGKWVRPVHEIWKIKGKKITFKNSILHYPHQDLTSFLNKINNYTTIESDYRIKNNKKFHIIEVFLYPIGKFIQNYLLNKGYKDGMRGLINAYFMCLHSLIVRIKLYEQKINSD